MPTLVPPCEMTSETTTKGNGCVRESSGATKVNLQHLYLVLDEEWLISYEMMKSFYLSGKPICVHLMSRLNPWLKRNKQDYTLFRNGVTDGHTMNAGEERSGRRSLDHSYDVLIVRPIIDLMRCHLIEKAALLEQIGFGKIPDQEGNEVGSLASVNSEKVGFLANVNSEKAKSPDFPDTGLLEPFSKKHSASIPRESLWLTRYNEMVCYKKVHGHYLPNSRKEPRLYAWMVGQRKLKSNGMLNATKLRLLEKIGFQWNDEQRDDGWYMRYNEMKTYKRKRGHCWPHSRNESSLYRWANLQRRKKASDVLDTNKVTLLEKIGFDWERQGSADEISESSEESRPASKYTWIDHYDALIEFKKKNGHMNITSNYPEVKYWVDLQRREFEKWELGETSKLIEERVRLLDVIGFDWKGVRHSDEKNSKNADELTSNPFKSEERIQVGIDDRIELWA